MNAFDLFIGIDWSGAKGEFHRGIQVASTNSSSLPQLISPPHKKGWSRQSVIGYLLSMKSQGYHILAGIDFAFSHPFGDIGYYPDSEYAPSSAQELWALLDSVNHDQDFFYGGGIWGHADLRRYYNAPKNRDGSGGRGDLFQSRRRLTENIAASLNKRSPSPTFNCVGPAGVGTEVLPGCGYCITFTIKHLFGHSMICLVMEWVRSLVEIFPALYFTMAGIKDKDKLNAPLASLNKALHHFWCGCSRQYCRGFARS